MVCINTQKPGLKFTHFVDIPTSEFVVGTARDENNRARVFLIARYNGKIYSRNGLNETWRDIQTEENYTKVRELIIDALADKSVPRFTTSGVGALN